MGARVEGWKRIDIPEYSLEVLREAVINAVMHRDYSKRGESIRVLYYPDRVEVHSPGLLLPGITVEHMERGEVQSKLRNPILAGLLRDIPGYMERFETCPASSLASIGLITGFITYTLLAFRALTGVLTGTASLSPERFIDLVHRLLLHRRQDVRVDVQGDGDLAVPEYFLDNLRMHFHAQEHSGRAMA